MGVIEILLKIKSETDRLRSHLEASSARFYEISTCGTIVERTVQLHDYYATVQEQLQRAIELLRRPRGPTGPRPI